jgi:hypothetical protein
MSDRHTSSFIESEQERNFKGGHVPFKSEAQRHYFGPNKRKLEKQGVDVESGSRRVKG